MVEAKRNGIAVSLGVRLLRADCSGRRLLVVNCFNRLLLYQNLEKVISLQKHTKRNDYKLVLFQTIDWITEQVAKCKCMIGNHIYRTALLDRLMEKREAERTLDIVDFESDQIIEALAHAQMINQQMVPFSTVF